MSSDKKRGDSHLFDDLYRLPQNQLQLVLADGFVGKRHLAFPRVLRLLCWRARERERGIIAVDSVTIQEDTMAQV